MKIIDLHTHSNYSDGTLSPAALVARAKKRGLAAIAITDHDEAGGLNEAQLAGMKYGIEIVAGIELVAEYRNEEIHILGYFIDYKGQYFINALESFRKIREERNNRLIKRLSELGMVFDESDLQTEGGALTRLHFAKAMAKNGYTKTVSEAFDRYLNAGRPAFVGRNAPGYYECIEVVRKAGGVSALAHPYSYKWTGGEVVQMVEVLRLAGLDGVEAYYSLHTPAQTSSLLKAAERFSLKVTGGSDFHGENRPEIELGIGKGSLCVGYEILENLKRRI